MSLITRNPVFGICDQVRLKPARSGTVTSKQRYYTIQAKNNKGSDQTAQMRRLICAFVVGIWQKQVFHDAAQIKVSVKFGVIYDRGRHPYKQIHSRFNSINCHAEIF